MALSPAAREALEKFKSQRTALGTDDVAIETPRESEPIAPPAPAAESPVSAFLSGAAELFRPEQPRTFEESGISFRVMESLLLKTIKQEGPQTEEDLGTFLCLSMNVFRGILHSLHRRELLDTPTPLYYDLTTKGRELVEIMERDDAYIGPAPVSFHDYCNMVRLQAKRERLMTMDDIEKVFEEYPMRPEVKRTLKEGFNSQQVMLFYGPPGNGKSMISDNLHRLLADPILLPFAFEFNSKVVQVYDQAYHRLREDLMRREERGTAQHVSGGGKPDKRWLISTAPLVTVGTEFKVAHFEIIYDGQYFAPPHVKANNGIFILDDLGRQIEDHNTILNQFIYPLEEKEALVRFAGGSTLKVPYAQRLFLSTNLNHEDILDDAFKRRLLYQVLVDRPTEALWKDIFIRMAVKNGLEMHHAAELGELLVQWYLEDDRVIRACDPRNLFTMINASLDDGTRLADSLDRDLLHRIFEDYPASYKKDIKYYVGAMDVPPGM
jgi:hypothetical protein